MQSFDRPLIPSLQSECERALRGVDRDAYARDWIQWILCHQHYGVISRDLPLEICNYVIRGMQDISPELSPAFQQVLARANRLEQFDGPIFKWEYRDDPSRNPMPQNCWLAIWTTTKAVAWELVRAAQGASKLAALDGVNLWPYLRARLGVDADDSAHHPFLFEILESPGDATPQFVYADWLEDQGDDRAALWRSSDSIG